MTALVIVLIILFGIVLILLEILVLPGITLAALGGVVLLVGGVYLSYETYGLAVGHFTVLGTIVLTISMLIIALKSNTWNKIKLNAKIDSKVEKLDEDAVTIGDVGVCISRLAPMGKVKINKILVEAKSIGMYIDEKSEIEVVGILDKIVIVKPI